MKKASPILLVVMVLAAFVALSGARGQNPAFPTTDRYVDDLAKVLTPEEDLQLSTICRNLDRDTGYQLVVLTLRSLEGGDPNQVATDYGLHKRAGKAGKDTGVVMLLSIEDRQFYIALGKGTVIDIPASYAGRISRDVVRPLLRQGRYGQALIAGANAISERIRSRAGGSDGNPDAPGSLPRNVVVPGAPGAGVFVMFLLVGGFIAVASALSANSVNRCPRCGARMTSSTETGPNWRRGGGAAYLTRSCPRCGYSDRRRLPRRARSGGGAEDLVWLLPLIFGGRGGGGGGGWSGGGGWGGGDSGGGWDGGGFSGGGGDFGGDGAGTSW